MFGTNSNHGGRDGYLQPIASTVEDLTYSFNSEASQHEKGNKSYAERSNKGKNADKYPEGIAKIGASNPSKNNVGKDDNQLGLIYRHIYSTVNNALNLSTQDEELTFPSNHVWDDFKAQDSKRTVKRRGRVNSTEVQRVDTIENLSRIYKSRRKSEIDDNSIFFTSIMRELRKQNKHNLTSIIDKKLAEQARGFNMNLVVPSRHRTSSVKTRSRENSMSKESSILVNGKPFTRKEGRTGSIRALSNENSGKDLQRARPHSEGRCFFPDSIVVGKCDNATGTKSRKERFNLQRKKEAINNNNSKNGGGGKTETTLKLPKEYNSLEPPSNREAELNRSPSLRELNTEEDQSPIMLGDKKPKFSDTVSKTIKDKLNQTYAWPAHQFSSPSHFAKHEKNGPPIPKSKTSSPLKIDMSFDRQKQQEYLRLEKEKFRRERIQRSHEYKKLMKSRIMNDFERISRKLKAYQVS